MNWQAIERELSLMLAKHISKQSRGNGVGTGQIVQIRFTIFQLAQHEEAMTTGPGWINCHHSQGIWMLAEIQEGTFKKPAPVVGKPLYEFASSLMLSPAAMASGSILERHIPALLRRKWEYAMLRSWIRETGGEVRESKEGG